MSVDWLQAFKYFVHRVRISNNRTYFLFSLFINWQTLSLHRWKRTTTVHVYSRESIFRIASKIFHWDYTLKTPAAGTALVNNTSSIFHIEELGWSDWLDESQKM